MKKVVLACALLSVLGGVASAADRPVKAPYSAPPPPPAYYTWTGFYIGGNIGSLAIVKDDPLPGGDDRH